jgi:ribosomal protein S18 acetylase RimI-like enzyme
VSVALRPALPEDGSALAALARQVFTETFGAHYDAGDLAAHLDRTFGPGGLPAELEDPAFRVMLAEESGALAAYLKLAPMALPVDHPAGSLEIRQLYVLEPWQGKGVAQRLMDWAIDTARARGAPALYLSVWSQNARAIAFYRRYGFVVAGTAPFAVGARIDEDPVMRFDLGPGAA